MTDSSSAGSDFAAGVLGGVFDVSMPLDALSYLVARPRGAFVLVIASVARLCVLRILTRLDHLRVIDFVDAVLDAKLGMRFGTNGQAIWELHVRVILQKSG